jgi:plastocyanin
MATPTSNGASVAIVNFAFSPQSLTIQAGTTVTWTNLDSETQSVTADNGVFNARVPPGGSVSFTFKRAGTYPYHCVPHPEMTGTIIVH